MEVKKFVLGQELRDIVSGFKGIAIARVEYLNGCVQYGLKPKAAKGKEETMPEAQYIDIQQLVVVGEGILKTKKPPRKPGGVMPDAPRC
jgi:hypothetical protein